MPSSPSDPLGILGTTLNEKYEMELFVAEGGFSLLYRAQHRIWKQPVAVKFLKVMASAPENQRKELFDSFIQEGQLLRQLSSRTASILQAHDVGTWASTTGEWYPYLILEWLDGKPLDLILDEFRAEGHTPLTLPEILHCFTPVAKALDVVHRKGVAHRDIKPANLFVLGDFPSEEAHIKVLDFGIAKVLGDMAEISATNAKTGLAISSFTPWYGAPEQFSKRYGATGPWTDVFALALVLVELLSLRSPLDGNDVIQLSVQSMNPTERPSPRQRGVDLPDEIEEIFLKALAINPADRYPTAGAFWDALCQAAGAAQYLDGPLSRTTSTGTDPHARASALGKQPTGRSDIAHAATIANPTTLQPNTTGSTSLSGAQLASTPPSRSPLLLGVATVALLGVGALLFGRKSNQEVQVPSTPVLSATNPSAKPSASAASAPPAPLCPEGMVHIPGSDFYMGFDGEGALPFEMPVHPVKLDSFCIDVTEVTVEQYRDCSENGKCRRASTSVQWPGISKKDEKIYSPLCNIDSPGRDRHPINCVTWEMADNFCKRHDKRLPSSAEWEFAVRGPDGRTFPWGDEPPDANHLNACGKECVEWGKKNGVVLDPMYQEDDSFPTTAPVGSFPKGRSRYGLDDVIGNVMEWVHDWDGPYDKAPSTNPMGPESGKERVIRGGAWNAGSMNWVRPSFRFKFPPDAMSHGIGFRCAK